MNNTGKSPTSKPKLTLQTSESPRSSFAQERAPDTSEHPENRDTVSPIVSPTQQSKGILESDIIILVTGRVGVGRTEFITTCVGSLDKTYIRAHSRQDSALAGKIRAYAVPSGRLPAQDGARVVLVDAPGFDNPEQTLFPDPFVVKTIEEWLGDNKVNAAGFVHLANQDPNKYGSGDKNIEGLRKRFERMQAPKLGVPQGFKVPNLVVGIVWNLEWKIPRRSEESYQVLKDHWKDLAEGENLRLNVGKGDKEVASSMVQILLAAKTASGSVVPPKHEQSAPADEPSPSCWDQFLSFLCCRA